MDMPPTRFRVVERGRRLEVIDSATGRVVGARSGSDRVGSSVAATRADKPLMLDRVVGRASVPRGTPAPKAGALPRATRFDGTVSFTTRAFYDDRAPRTVTLDPARAKMLRGAAFAALLLLIIMPALLLTLAIVSHHFTAMGGDVMPIRIEATFLCAAVLDEGSRERALH